MITWRVGHAPDTDLGDGAASTTRDAWYAALSLAVHAAQHTPQDHPLEITVGDHHARLYPGHDHGHDPGGTSRVAADLLAALTADTGIDETPSDQPPQPPGACITSQACGIPWPACPRHGNTITSSGGHSWCRTCGRTWTTSDIEPCPAPVTHLVTDTAGTAIPMCRGHTHAARIELIGAKIESLPARPQTPDNQRDSPSA